MAGRTLRTAVERWRASAPGLSVMAVLLMRAGFALSDDRGLSGGRDQVEVEHVAAAPLLLVAVGPREDVHGSLVSHAILETVDAFGLGDGPQAIRALEAFANGELPTGLGLVGDLARLAPGVLDLGAAGAEPCRLAAQALNRPALCVACGTAEAAVLRGGDGGDAGELVGTDDDHAEVGAGRHGVLLAGVEAGQVCPAGAGRPPGEGAGGATGPVSSRCRGSPRPGDLPRRCTRGTRDRTRSPHGRGGSRRR